MTRCAALERSNPPVRWRSIKRILASVLCHPCAGTVIGFIWRNRIPHRKRRIEVLDGGDPRVNALIYWGLYESAELRFVRRYIGNDLDVVELGSSLGVVSCQIACQLSGDALLVCVEANGEILPVLKRNIASNTFNHNVRFLHGAIDYAGNDIVGLLVGPNNLTGRVCQDQRRCCAVPAVTLASVLEANEIGDYVLVSDIEGAEAGIFQHDSCALGRCRRMIIELHESVYDGDKYTVQRLIDMVHETTDMQMCDRYGPVCVFDRA